jgi:hypothetical protein
MQRGDQNGRCEMEKYFLVEIYEDGCPTGEGRGTLCSRRISPVFESPDNLVGHIKNNMMKIMECEVEVVRQYGRRNALGLFEEESTLLEDWLPVE